MIVTIDGPAGAGKSCAARELARRLGIHFLDTGSMYRAVAFAVREAGIDPDDETAISNMLQRVELEFAPDVVRLNGRDLTGIIRTPEVTSLSSRLAALPTVRAFLVARQQAIGRKFDLVTEGRDQGTIVFPKAERKFFLIADPKERALRRHKDLLVRGTQITIEEVVQAQEERDRRDAQRHTGPMIPAPDAITIDSSGRSPDEVVAEMEARVRECWTP
jgi:cytidylate kinase